MRREQRPADLLRGCGRAHADDVTTATRRTGFRPLAASAISVLLPWVLGMGGCSVAPSLLTSESKPATAVMSLMVESVPPGAEARIRDGASCRTPCQLAITPMGPFMVDFTLQDQEAQSVEVVLAASNPDDISAGIRLEPNPVRVALTAIAHPSSKRRPASPMAAKTSPPTSATTSLPEQTGIVGSRWLPK